MYRNYFLFARQVKDLNTILPHARIDDCFTYQKNELVLKIQSDQEYFLRINVEINSPYLMITPVQNIKSPFKQFFPELIDNKIEEISIQPFDKIIFLATETYRLKMCFFGKNSNILLLDLNNTVVDNFKNINKLTHFESENHTLDPLKLEIDHLQNILKQEKKYTLDHLLARYIAGFNTLLAREACYRSNYSFNQDPVNLKNKDWEQLITSIQEITRETEFNKCRIYSNTTQIYLSLIDLTQLNNSYECEYFDSVNDAWDKFLYYQRQKLKLNRMLTKMKAVVENRIEYLNKSLIKIKTAANMDARKKEAELKGNLLLTYAHKLSKGTKKVNLPNIFSKDQEEISIKINPAKSAHENAQKYFNKYKNLDDEKLKLSLKTEHVQREINYWQEAQNSIAKVSSLKQAEKIYSKLTVRKMIQTDDNRIGNDLAYSFHHIVLGQKWEVYIGKNDKNNDLLTFKFAKKYDLWFHAQGVPGSHVVIRLPIKNQLPPHDIIEQTASLAAYFSRAKHSSTVPVIYTFVRYVRKPRKANSGTVQVTNEKTIFVIPKKLI